MLRKHENTQRFNASKKAARFATTLPGKTCCPSFRARARARAQQFSIVEQFDRAVMRIQLRYDNLINSITEILKLVTRARVTLRHHGAFTAACLLFFFKSLRVSLKDGSIVANPLETSSMSRKRGGNF